MQRAFEKLESRTLYAAGTGIGGNTIPAPYEDPFTLAIHGTPADDSITLTQSGSTLTVNVNGTTTQHNLNNYFTVAIFGHDGNDQLFASWAGPGNTLRGGAGNDKLWGGLMDDTLEGGTGDDELHGNAGHDTLRGQIGNDTGFGDAGDDWLYGGGDNDDLRGGNGIDQLFGDAGDDTLRGEADINALHGGEGHDTLYGGTTFGAYNDIDGEGGNDTFIAGNASDDFSGGAGTDTASYAGRLDNIRVTLNNTSDDGKLGEVDNIHSDVEIVFGGSGNDVLIGSSAANILHGNAGHDEIHGRGGNDELFGEAGNDRLFGGEGRDELTGGAGDDILVDVGGGSEDFFTGGADYDTFWLDQAGTESHDADANEINTRAVHRIGSFANFASKELNGQSIPDPETRFELLSYEPLVTYVPGYVSMAGNPLFSSIGPSMNDVKQGLVGDCTLMATLAAVVRASDQRIYNMIADLGDGTYAVRLYQNGSPVDVRVDADLPINRFNTGLQYAKPGYENSLWVGLVEKAAAIVRGSYSEIHGMYQYEGFDLLGIGNWTIDGDGAEALAYIRQKLLAGEAVTASSDEVVFDGGRTGPHAWTVTEVSADLKTITMRNPWSVDGFTRDGNPSDGLVTFSVSEFEHWFYHAQWGNV